MVQVMCLYSANMRALFLRSEDMLFSNLFVKLALCFKTSYQPFYHQHQLNQLISKTLETKHFKNYQFKIVWKGAASAAAKYT